MDVADPTSTLLALDMAGALQAGMVDSTGTVGGALLGASPVTSYNESAAGAGAGGRPAARRSRRAGRRAHPR